MIHDLDTARILLKPVDRAVQDEFKDMYNHYVTDADNVFLSARAYRMNYWADRVVGESVPLYGDPKAYTYVMK
ncbi:MAG: hypothetical protein ACLU30_19430 [Odoribacter splanchnicus]